MSDTTTKRWEPIWGIQSIADRYCGGNRRRAENLIYRGTIKVRKFGRLTMADPRQIERALMQGLE